MSDLALLQALRLKGRAVVADIAATTGMSEADVEGRVQALAAEDKVAAGKMLRLTPTGREELTALLIRERDGIDAAAVAAAYEEFRSVNTEFKALISDWQLRDGEPNAHDDAAYDAAVVDKLGGIHNRITPIVASASAVLPRLGSYGDKLDAALAKVRAGDAMWFTRPIVDSYHTVWFELHEELIGASGLTREDEAKAGHAQ